MNMRIWDGSFRAFILKRSEAKMSNTFDKGEIRIMKELSWNLPEEWESLVEYLETQYETFDSAVLDEELVSRILSAGIIRVIQGQENDGSTVTEFISMDIVKRLSLAPEIPIES